MNFGEALELMKQGKKVRRESWQYEGLYKTKRLYIRDNELYADFGLDVESAYIAHKDILAEDWEEYSDSLLTGEEKDYLRKIITFSSEKIVSLKKCFNKADKYDYTVLAFYDEKGYYIGQTLYFNLHEHFKDLGAEKEYTLKELGLEE